MEISLENLYVDIGALRGNVMLFAIFLKSKTFFAAIEIQK